MSSTWTTTEESAVARQLLRSIESGVLSTMSLELPGYPFGSVTPYALTMAGKVAIYVSDIAQHTRNMAADPKVCLTVVAQAGAQNQQAVGRVTVVGDAQAVPDDQAEQVAERYFAFFPEARAYAGTHGFGFFTIAPQRVRFIGGFGKIYWVEARDWAVPAPEWSSAGSSILEHMNSDHAPALAAIARKRGVQNADATELVSLDVEGFHIRSGEALSYVPFPAPCLTTEQVRAGMIDLTRAADEAS
ncbi:MAG: putative heme iron utilization protein [Planctomycetota bacterium]|jgi:putative heme iron utilization protein